MMLPSSMLCISSPWESSVSHVTSSYWSSPMPPTSYWSYDTPMSLKCSESTTSTMLESDISTSHITSECDICVWMRIKNKNLFFYSESRLSGIFMLECGISWFVSDVVFSLPNNSKSAAILFDSCGVWIPKKLNRHIKHLSSTTYLQFAAILNRCTISELCGMAKWRHCLYLYE